MNPTNQEAEKIRTENFQTANPPEAKPQFRKKRPIRSYHLESDIFHTKPNNNEQRKIKTYYNSDIFFVKNETQKQTKKKPVKRDLYSESSNHQANPERKTKTYLNIQAKETTQKDVRTKRFMPEKRKEDKENTLAYDLSNSKPQIERPQKRIFPNKKKEEEKGKGKRILVERLKEDPGNTLAYYQ